MKINPIELIDMIQHSQSQKEAVLEAFRAMGAKESDIETERTRLDDAEYLAKWYKL